MERGELFELAVTRAATYLDRLMPAWRRESHQPSELRTALELWYLRTRFAYRVPLEEVVAALMAPRAAEEPGTDGSSGKA